MKQSLSQNTRGAVASRRSSRAEGLSPRSPTSCHALPIGGAVRRDYNQRHYSQIECRSTDISRDSSARQSVQGSRTRGIGSPFRPVRLELSISGAPSCWSGCATRSSRVQAKGSQQQSRGTRPAHASQSLHLSHGEL